MTENDKMSRINNVLNHDLFLFHLHENETAERDRRFCRHDMTHFLNVARIGEIINLENNYGIDRELIYAAALLHDMGKHIQYESGVPHDEASADIAPEILKECGFDEYETRVIINAIKSHRDAGIADKSDLRGVLYRADKASRDCFACSVEKECNWKNDKKNLYIRI